MIRCVLQLLFLLLISQNLYSQKLIAQHYTMANGLPSNEVFSIHKDKNGFIWLGTDRGVCKFDGKTFKVYTVKEGLPENTILEVKEDKLGRIWCRSFSGLFTIIDRDSIYAAKINEEIKRLTIGTQLYQFELDDSLNIYFATRNNGLIYKSPLPYNNVNQLQLPLNNLSFFQINASKHIMSYNMILKSKIKDLKTTVALKNEIFTNTIIKANIVQNYFLRYVFTSKFLVFSTHESIQAISLQTKKVISKRLPFVVSSMTLLSDSTTFIGGFNGELAVYNFNKNTYKVIDKFPSSISNIYYEKNTYWISTLRNGIYYVPNINYKVLYVDSEPLISMLPVSNDSLYLLNANAEIELINNEKVKKIEKGNELKTLMYWQRFDHSQKEFIPLVGSSNYIIKRTTKEKIKFNVDNGHNWNQTEFVVPIDSLIYASNYGGLRVFNQKGKGIKSTIPINGRATCMFGNKSILYIGALNGIYKLDNNKSVPLDTHSFFKNRVTAIDKIGADTLVIATQTSGIGIYNLITKTLSIINNNVGLDRLIIQYVFVDDESKIWIATQKSIHVLKLNSKNEYELLDVVDLNLGDLSIKEVRTLNKQVYILVGNQVVNIAENLIQYNSQPYPIVLNKLMINGKNRDLTNLAANDLLPNENNLLINFQLLSFTQNHEIEYRYKLNNEAWVYTSNNELQLASFPSATYTLSIQGRLRNGAWSNMIPINFTIGNSFYKTWWFVSLLVIGSTVLLYYLLSFYFKRKFRKRLKEFELKRELESARLMASKSQMNPHFIFNALNSIQNFVIKSDKMQAYQYLTDFSTLIRNYLEYSNKDYVKLDKEIELINTYIKIEQLRIPFQYELHLLGNLKASNEYIFTLLLQPCLENAIWHGLNHKTGDKKISVIIKKTNNLIEISITDNGIGRAQSAIINANRINKPSSVATNNMLSRINSLKLLHKNDIKIKILDNFDENATAIGTTVLISFEIIYEKN